MKKEITTKDLRIFGFIWGIIFTVIAYKSTEFRVLFGVIALVFVFSAVACPQLYFRFKIYQCWVKFGEVLGRINSTIIIWVLFYGIFAPVGILLRLLKKDLLNKNLDKTKNSYFTDRTVQPENMRQQF